MKIHSASTVALYLLLYTCSSLAVQAHASEVIRVGSKNFNESYLLGEIVAQTLEAGGFNVERKFGLGGTLICYEALKNLEIDIYVEYTGTLGQAILKMPGNPVAAEINQALAGQQLELLPQFGFNNTYAIAVTEHEARTRGLHSIADLAGAPELSMVFSHEFLERKDGWPGLQAAYGLRGPVRGIEHGLAYQALHAGSIGVTDAYSTDGELVRYNLRVLQDTLNYFPSYYAAPLVNRRVTAAARRQLAVLTGSIDDARMQALNAEVVFAGRSFAEVAADFLAPLGVVAPVRVSNMWVELRRNTLRHLQLTGMALGLAIFVGLLVSLLIYRHERLASAVIYFCGLLQTIPSIALLALMIPLFGIGMLPAVIALFLYSLLPILRNAVTALSTVDPSLTRVALALGLSERDQLRHVLVPLSLPAIFAGIRTAAVISIGTATLAAFIGAGGLGDPIVVGLSLDNVEMILQGAIPAALLAIFTELGFGLLERWVTART